MWQQVFQSNRFGAKNHDCDFTSTQILLVSKTAVHRRQDIKTCSFRGFQKLTVLEPTKAGVPSRLAFVPRQVIAHSLIDTLVEQNPHVRECLAVSDNRVRQELFGLFESGNCHVARHRRKSF